MDHPIPTLSDPPAVRADYIRQVVTAAGAALRQRHPWLRHQDAIGALILAVAWGGMLASGWAYLTGHLSAWFAIPLSAFFASLTHELEHDLIHCMYFRKKPWAHHLMLALCWLARPSTINPWVRRELHFEHHKFSGSERDREERGITNGERWGPARLLMLGDPTFSAFWRIRRVPDPAIRRQLWKRFFKIYFPLGTIHWSLWYVFLGTHAALALAALAGAGWTAPAWLPLLDAVIVVWIAPNVWRSFCLHFVSSNMHYYGDIDSSDVIQQTQILDRWWLLPLQTFCFNFGSTHAIHHFVVKEPFYVRQWTAREAHRVMLAMGVRRNDLGTFRRANRWQSREAA